MAEPSGNYAQSSRLPKEPLIVAALIVIVSVTLAVGGIVFKTRESLQRDKVEFLADANQKQVGPLRRVIQLRLAQDKARLIQFAATRSALGPGRARVFGDFALVSLLTPGAGGQWGFSWIEKGPLYPQLQGVQATLTSDQEVALLKSLPYDRIREGDIHWQRLSDSGGRAVWALAVSVETAPSSGASGTPGAPTATTSTTTSGASNAAPTLPEGTDYQTVQVGTGGRAVVVGLFASNPLLSATEDFIGSTSTAFVIDGRGYAATHSNKAMVGSLLRDDPSVKEIFSARSSAGATRYQSPQGAKIFSAFEQVDRANLYVVMSTPETIASSLGQNFGRTAVTTGLLALMVGLFLVFAWGARLLPKAGVVPSPTLPRLSLSGEPNTSSFPSMPTPRPPKKTKEAERETSKEVLKETSGPSSNSSGVMPEGLLSEQAMVQSLDRAAFVGRFVSGLERGMKEPLLAAMAHVQLVKVKATDAPSAETLGEIADHVSAVDRDLRRAKEMIDELSQLSSQSSVPTADERIDLNRLVSSTVEARQATLAGEGISLRAETGTVPLVRGREEPVRKILNEILKNSARSLKGRSNKSIHLKLEDDKDTVRLAMTDNGVGMDRETRAQAFEPFFHGFDDPEARGLGLATVRSIIQAQGGTCEISSAPGDGTTITLHWPVLASERESFANRPVKVQTSTEAFEQTNSMAGVTIGGGSSIDFDQEGAYALGGKVPLSAEHASSLPPSPRFGADDDDDEKDEAWAFDPTTKSALGEPTAVAPAMSGGATDGADVTKTTEIALGASAEPVKIRPVRRG